MNTSCTCRPRPLALLQLTMLSVLWSGATARAVIDVGSVTVPSIGHSFFPPQLDPPFPGFVGDVLVGGENGGATLSPVHLDLDTDTQISFTIRAPLGQKFLIEPPDGAAAFFSAPFAWSTFAAPDSGTSLGASVSFQDLVGTAPTFSSHSTVGADNQFFTFDRTSASFTDDLSFTAITLTVTYAPRATGNGTLTYQPYNPQNSTIEPRFLIGYSTALATDPGRFVSIVPLHGRAWDSGGASDLWSDAGNWDPDGAPANGDSLIFGSGVRTTSIVDYSSLSVNAVAFTATAPAFTIHVPESGSARQLTITGALTNASAQEQTLVADGASGPGNSGVLSIESNSMSGPFALIARGPTGAGPNGGVIQFFGVADGITARVITEPGSYFEFGARLGSLRLGSIEGGGLVLMGGNPLLVGFNNLDTEFSGTLAGGPLARLEKHGTGRLILSESNTYGGGTFVSGGILEVRAPANGIGLGNAFIQGGSELVFSQAAVGDFQTINAQPASVVGQNGGLLRFTDSASAGRLTMLAEGVSAGFNAGRIIFEESSNAGTSTSIELQSANGANGSPGTVTFTGSATATGATITNGGLTDFLESATAGSATIINRAAAVNFGRPGETTFQADSTAGSATIINEAGSAANRFGGKTFIGSDAGTATITAMGGGFPGGQGQVTFFGGGSAAQSTVTTGGATAAGFIGGVALFTGASTAGEATLIAQSGQAPGATGGLIIFMDQASGGFARAILDAGGRFDISSISIPSITIGSIEGAGTVFLGSKELIVGGNDASTTLSGIITDGGEVGGTGGSLTKTGAGALTLSGINVYTGTTTVLEGTLNVDSPLFHATIDVLGGVLNVNADVTGSAILVASVAGTATANFHTSQQLESLTIGDGGLVVLGEMLPPAPAGFAVPEPGTLSLFLLGMLPLLRRRSAPFQNSSARMIRFPREIRM